MAGQRFFFFFFFFLRWGGGWGCGFISGPATETYSSQTLCQSNIAQICDPIQSRGLRIFKNSVSELSQKKKKFTFLDPKLIFFLRGGSGHDFFLPKNNFLHMAVQGFPSD